MTELYVQDDITDGVSDVSGESPASSVAPLGDAILHHRGGELPFSQHRVGELVVTSPGDYDEWVMELKQRVRNTQVRAMRAANSEVLHLYWSIGHDILERQERDGWGTSVIDRLSRDMQHEFPGQRGWSVSSLEYMRRFAKAWSTEEDFRQHRVGELPWGHVRRVAKPGSVLCHAVEP
jgi:hypothetical protein